MPTPPSLEPLSACRPVVSVSGGVIGSCVGGRGLVWGCGSKTRQAVVWETSADVAATQDKSSALPQIKIKATKGNLRCVEAEALRCVEAEG